jgi:serine/threonine protein kinase
MITEYCPSSLKKSIEDKNNYKDTNLLEKWMSYAYQLASGMEVLSRRGIIHRDLKVENCLIDSHGTIKICDFGLAITKDTINRMSTLSLSQIVSQGTLGYIAPERLFDGKISDASDVYSYGIIIAYMLFGKFPWVDESGRALDNVTVSNMIKDGRLPECFDDLNDGIYLPNTILI